jgi:RNA polymerase sigma-70 factor (sigma-E family)
MDASEHFDDFYQRAWPVAVRLAYLLTGASDVAEDVAQDAFTRMHQRWDRIDNPPGYLRTSVVHGCHSWHRSRRSEANRLQQVRAPEPYGDAADALALRDAIGSLPYRQRAVIVLRYYVDLPEAEIARTVGCRPGTVKSLASRALTHLRTVVDQ